MWDSYNPNGSGVRLTFEKNLLKREIIKSGCNVHNLHFKSVTYKTYNKIISELENNKILIDYFNTPNKDLINYLFNKRSAYRYEEEYRLFYDANKDEVEYLETFSIKINPKLLIDKILFNPKMAYCDTRAITKYLIGKGIKKEIIKNSFLYKRKLARTIKL